MADKKFIRDLNRLISPKQKKSLSPPEARSPITGETLIVFPTDGDPPQSSGGGGGIASPLTEGDITQRTYYAPEVVYSSDGLFSFTLEKIETIKFTDANGDPVDITFAQ